MSEQLQALRRAVIFIRDLAEEELPYARVGTGQEVALRHILRRAREALDDKNATPGASPSSEDSVSLSAESSGPRELLGALAAKWETAIAVAYNEYSHGQRAGLQQAATELRAALR